MAIVVALVARVIGFEALKTFRVVGLRSWCKGRLFFSQMFANVTASINLIRIQSKKQ